MSQVLEETSMSETTSLEELRDQLVKHLKDLNQAFIELFNNNYDQFFQLSSIIARLEQPLDKLTQPFNLYKDKLVELCSQFEQYIGDIDEKQSQLILTCQHKSIASRFIQLVKRRDHLEGVIEDIDWSVGSQNRNILQFDLLERVNVELHYLSAELEIMQPMAELYQMQKFIETSMCSRQKQLDTWFESAFLEAVDLNHNSHIDLVVRTYEQKDEIKKLDSVFLNNVVRPYLTKLITDSNVISNLDAMYDQIENFIDNKSNLIKCNFAKECCWKETLDILARLTSLYSLENLESFKKRYTSTMLFLGRNKIQEKQVLNNFNLKSYFQNRYYQIATSVEETLSKDPLSSESTTSVYKLKVCNDIHQWITACWSPDIYIPQLYADFHKLVCQILNRFAFWLSRLRLSDFKIQGQKGQTNFLAEHNALMSLLTQDCNLLVESIGTLRLSTFSKNSLGAVDEAVETVCPETHSGDEDLDNLLMDLYDESFCQIKKGLANVYSLQKLIEK